jgi:hypothetical protein
MWEWALWWALLAGKRPCGAPHIRPPLITLATQPQGATWLAPVAAWRSSGSYGAGYFPFKRGSSVDTQRAVSLDGMVYVKFCLLIREALSYRI